MLNTFSQKVENRKLGITGGFHGVLRWSHSEESDELFEFLILHQHKVGTGNSEIKSRVFQQSISIYLKALAGSDPSLSASSILWTLDREFFQSLHKGRKSRRLPNLTRQSCKAGVEEDNPEENCPVCMEMLFTEPVVTDCGHIICWPCFVNLRLHNRDDCPMCRHKL